MIKATLTGLLAALFCLTLVGCGGGDDKSDGGGKSAKSSAKTDTGKKDTAKKDGAGKKDDSGKKDDPPAAEGTGTLVGTVKLSGDAPSLEALVAEGAAVKDPTICAVVAVPSEAIVVGEAGGLANVFVYLPRAPKGAEAGEPREVVIDQKGCRFFPHASVSATSDTVRVISSDDCAHNVHVVPVQNAEVNSLMQPKDQTGLALDFTKAEILPVKIKCDIHSWMSHYHLPLDHPFAAVTDESGSFRIEGLPVGKHQFRLWHESADGGYLEKRYEVEIEKDQETKVELEYAADDFGV